MKKYFYVAVVAALLLVVLPLGSQAGTIKFKDSETGSYISEGSGPNGTLMVEKVLQNLKSKEQYLATKKLLNDETRRLYKGKYTIVKKDERSDGSIPQLKEGNIKILYLKPVEAAAPPPRNGRRNGPREPPPRDNGRRGDRW